MFGGTLYTISIWIVPVLLAVTLHEAAHGYAAMRLGDDTALRAGRLSLNPLRHIDPVGTVLVPALMLFATSFLFGWAKPVPVDFTRLRPPRLGMVWVAAAGPGTNVVLALASAVLLHGVSLFPTTAGMWLAENLYNSIVINLVLAVFNMLPLPPLDGGRVAVGLLPASLARPLAGLERVGLFIIIGVLFILPMIGDQLGVDLNVFLWLVQGPVEFLFELVMNVAGHG